jgi:alkylation response protein AidB-like acyl-CoA dehydrogenase
MEGRPIDTIGYRGMHSYEIALDDWWVPAETSSAARTASARASTTRWPGFENGRLQTAARAVGVMQAAYEEALEYAENRPCSASPSPTTSSPGPSSAAWPCSSRPAASSPTPSPR